MTMFLGVMFGELEINTKHNPNFFAKLYSLIMK
jgi:hypothetical protein